MTQNDQTKQLIDALIKIGSNGANSKTAEGNTNSAVPKKKRDIPGKHWCFTLNNYTEIEVAQMEQDFSTFCKKWIYGKEIGENNTPHLQGYFELTTKDRFSGVKTKFGDRYHFEKMKGTLIQAVSYCTKDGDYKHKGKFPIICFDNSDQLDVGDSLIEESNFYPWQEKVHKIIKDKNVDDRSIYWFWEETGSAGKSALTKFLAYNYNALLIRKGKDADIMNAAFNYKDDELKLVICDIPRSTGNRISTTAIESIKDGVIVNTKYETGQKLIISPKIIIFSNMYPDTSELSKDRWKIFKIVNKDLVFEEVKIHQEVAFDEMDF